MIQIRGLKIIIIRLIADEAFIANPVEFFFAKIFGMVSPKIMTRTVRTIVAIQVYLSLPIARITSTDASEEAAMLTRLFPMRIALSALSKLPVMRSAVRALRQPFAFSSLMFSSLTVLQAEKAISEAEKKAESRMQRTRPMETSMMLILLPPRLRSQVSEAPGSSP